MLTVEALVHRYGDVQALDKVSFSLDRGVTALVGVNGAGKTTLLGAISGALRPRSGRIAIRGHDPYGRDRRMALRAVALMPQSVTFPRRMTAQEVVAYLAWLRAHRWIATGLLALGLAVLGWATRTTRVSIPLVEVPLPARLLVALGTTMIVLTPLYSSFPEFEPGLVREPGLRMLRVVLASTLAVAAVAPAWAAGPSDTTLHANLVWFCLLVASGIAIVTVVGELAWAVPFSLGAVSLVLDGDREQRVSGLLAEVQTPVAIAILGLAAALFVWRGPRRQGR